MSTKPTPGRYRWAVTVRIGSAHMDSSGAYVTDGKRTLKAIRDEIRQSCGETLARKLSMDPGAGRKLAELVRFDFTAD